MALSLKMNFSKCLKNLVVLRRINHATISLHSFQYSSQTSGPIRSKKPVKYTTNEAYKIQISETLGFNQEKEGYTSQLPKYIVLISTFGAFAYFAYFREENEIDDILKGKKTREVELFELKIKLNYCKQMKLPTDAIRARIEELENPLQHKSTFTK